MKRDAVIVSAVRTAIARQGGALATLPVHMFAVQVIACDRELEMDPEKVNINGGAIAHGHPLGATGAILITKAVYELKRRSGKYALITACIGGGQGIATIIERE